MIEPSVITGFPSIGIRKFTGMLGTSSSRSSNATSTTSRLSSPIPTMSPLHGSMPHFFAARSVSTRSAYVWVRADLGVVALARVQVVVQPVEPGLGQDARVLLAEQADREAHLDRVARLHLASRGRRAGASCASDGPRPESTMQ